jgi:hypothetical protein
MDYYQTNFSLMKELNWSLQDIENMFFWEREVYVTILVNYNNDKKQEMQHQQLMEKHFGI